jgi:ATP-dependent RNA helicase DDX31/DBP7
MKIQNLTNIQQNSFEPILKTNKDVMMKSETGSGKTLAYVIPMVQKLFELSLKEPIKREKGTYAIIISPTRELCIQIHNVIEKVTQRFSFLISGTIMGGEKKKSEKSRIKKGITILICTPGRLYDHLCNTECFVFDQLKFVIMDEADRLLVRFLKVYLYF